MSVSAKVTFCKTIFDFKLENKYSPSVTKAKGQKRVILTEFINLFNNEQPSVPRSEFLDQLSLVFEMISINLFRTPKVEVTSQSVGSVEEHLDTKKAADEEDVVMLEEQWPHLQIVYELLLRIIVAKDVELK